MSTTTTIIERGQRVMLPAGHAATARADAAERTDLVPVVRDMDGSNMEFMAGDLTPLATRDEPIATRALPRAWTMGGSVD